MTNNIYIFKKHTFSELNYLTNCAYKYNYIINFSDILFGLKSVQKCIYTGLAGQGLKF